MPNSSVLDMPHSRDGSHLGTASSNDFGDAEQAVNEIGSLVGTPLRPGAGIHPRWETASSAAREPTIGDEALASRHAPQPPAAVQR